MLFPVMVKHFLVYMPTKNDAFELAISCTNYSRNASLRHRFTKPWRLNEYFTQFRFLGKRINCFLEKSLPGRTEFVLPEISVKLSGVVLRCVKHQTCNQTGVQMMNEICTGIRQNQQSYCNYLKVKYLLGSRKILLITKHNGDNFNMHWQQ